MPYPLINASFKHPMRASTIRVWLDGRNVTEITQVGPMGFELTIGTHTVRVSGVMRSGQRISDGWSFAVTP